MWVDKFNLPDREPRQPKTEATQPQNEPEPSHLEVFEGYYSELFQVEFYMTARRTNGEEIPIGIRLLVPDMDLGAFCEVLHLNGLGYHCAPAEGGENEES